MARPFRYWPPEPRSDMLLRPRVQAVLAGRFDRRVTVVRAGAGFGKTTSIAQAFAENSLAPLGIDCWLACEPADAGAPALAQALAVVFGLSASHADLSASNDELDEFIGAVSEAIGARSPSQVCLSLDDVQFLSGGTSVQLIDRLVAALPSNAHLVLSGRSIPEIALTRLELIGDCVVLDEATLAFDPKESATVLGEPSGTVASETFGGWPALVQLAGSGRARTFVREEVLQGLTGEELSVLRCLAVLGECDVSVLERVAGHACERIIEVLPLVHRLGDRCAAHDLWSELLAPIDPSFVDATRRRAAEMLLADGASEDALDVLAPLALDRSDELVGRCLRASLLSPTRVSPERLRSWSAAWPDADGASDTDVCPEHVLVAALVARLDNPGSERSHSLLRRAAASFRAVGDGEASAVSLGALVYASHVRRDVAGLRWAFSELAALAEAGVVSAQPYPMLTSALIATSNSSPQEVVGFTTQMLDRPLGDELHAIVLWLHANALANLGENSVAPATACHEIGLPLPGMAAIYSGARWRAGRIRESLAEPTRTVDGTRDRFLQATWSCCLHAALGDIERARAALDVVEQAAGDASQWQTTGSIRLPQAILAYAQHRDDDAARYVRDFLAETPREGQGEFYRLFSIGLLVPLAPDERDWLIDRSTRPGFGPLYRRDLDLALAVHALDANADITAAATLAYPASAGEMMPSVGLRGGAPLLAAAVGAGRDDLGPLLEDWIDLLGERARSAWRALFDHRVAEVAAGARSLVEAMPIRPAAAVRLSVFGPTELSIGGVVVEQADWRRERVRALLTHLALVGETTRERVIAALWPEADAAAGRRNLRSTLNVLHSVLEPGRHGGDATFFVRTSGQRIRLVVAASGVDADLDTNPDAGIDVDVVRFELLLDRAVALERSGTPSLSIPLYLDAVGLYRGDLVPECYDDWAVFQRDRLRSRYVAGGVRVAELLVATGREADAIDTVSDVLTVEPWSESAHRALIAAHLSRGDLAAARRSLETCEKRLADIGGPSDDATFELVRRLARR
jgi:LuxR family transcriptional regulator, maltose regulon positive regulatory protein